MLIQFIEKNLEVCWILRRSKQFKLLPELGIETSSKYYALRYYVTYVFIRRTSSSSVSRTQSHWDDLGRKKSVIDFSTIIHIVFINMKWWNNLISDFKKEDSPYYRPKAFPRRGATNQKYAPKIDFIDFHIYMKI